MSHVLKYVVRPSVVACCRSASTSSASLYCSSITDLPALRTSPLITASVVTFLMPRDITVASHTAAVGSDECCHGQHASCFADRAAADTLVMRHSINLPFDPILAVEVLAEQSLLLYAKRVVEGTVN